MAMTEKNKQTMLVAGILGGAVLIAVLYFAWLRILPGISDARKKTEELEAKHKKNVEEMKKFKAQLDDTANQARVQETFARISSRLPPQQDPIDVFEVLRGYFEGTDVMFTSLEPGTQARRGKIMEYPFTIRGSARYHDFGQLINLIECNPERLMHVTSFTLKNSDKRPSHHPMTVTISTFTFNEN